MVQGHARGIMNKQPALRSQTWTRHTPKAGPAKRTPNFWAVRAGHFLSTRSIGTTAPARART